MLNFISSGKPSGIEIDILTEWANRRNWKLEFLVMDFASQIPAVQTGKADMAMGAISITEERQKRVLFSDGYFESHIVLITRKGESGILTNPSQPSDTEKDTKKWPWVAAILVIIIGCGAWFFVRRKHRTPITPNNSNLSTPNSQLITISHLKKSFENLEVLKDINTDVHRGEVILFDEPTSALDPTMVGEVLSVIRQLANEGMTMLIVTHEMKFAHDVSTRIFFMYDGYIHEDGTPQQVFENPVHSATKAFVQRIRKEVFQIDGPDFDFLGMHSTINAFCYKYGITEKQELSQQLTDKMLGDVMSAYRPITVRITHSEQSGVTALDFMVKKMETTPLSDTQRNELAALCQQIVEEPTTLGFRVKLII